MGFMRLHPLAQAEIEGQLPDFIGRLFRGGFKTGIAERIAAGGYPAALARRTPRRRRAWYRDYVETQIQRIDDMIGSG